MAKSQIDLLIKKNISKFPLLLWLGQLYMDCRLSSSNFMVVILRALSHRLYGRRIISAGNVEILGKNNIQTNDELRIGLNHVGFCSWRDVTRMNIDGSFVVNGRFSIGRGCRLDIGKNAVMVVGGGFVNPMTNFVIMNGLQIGHGCAISWGCQFLDDDFHNISYNGRAKDRDPKIVIGNHVWIGCNCIILKGVVIPDGCVISAGTVVSQAFVQKNVLIAGNPARIIKENVYSRFVLPEFRRNNEVYPLNLQ